MFHMRMPTRSEITNGCDLRRGAIGRVGACVDRGSERDNIALYASIVVPGATPGFFEIILLKQPIRFL